MASVLVKPASLLYWEDKADLSLHLEDTGFPDYSSFASWTRW